MSKCLIFLHGFPDNAKSWSYQEEYFNEDYELYIPDFNKYKDFSRKHVCEKIHKDTEKYTERIIICHDLGGVYGDYFARKYNCEKLIFINSYGLELFFKKAKSIGQLKKSWYMAPMQLPFVDIAMLLRKEYLYNSIYDLGEISSSDNMRDNIKDKNFYLVKMYKQFLLELLSSSDLCEINEKVIFILSDKDKFLTIPSKSFIEKYYKDAEIRVIDGGHWVHRQHPDIVNSLLDKEVL